MVHSAYETVLDYSHRLVNLQKIDQLLLWDGDVMMPPEGGQARAAQKEIISTLRFELLRKDELAGALSTLEDTELSGEQEAVVREIRREQQSARQIPKELYNEISAVSAQAHEKWKKAKEANDFSIWEPKLQEHFDLNRKKATHFDDTVKPFESLWTNRIGYLTQPHISPETVEQIFDELRENLVPLIREIEEAETTTKLGPLSQEFDTETQSELAYDLLKQLGFEESRTRFDPAPVGYSYGTQFDVRMTATFDEQDLLGGILTALHEFGHTLYTQGLPQEHYGTPLGEPRGLAIHESQSHLIQNHIGRSRAFWEFARPTIVEYFPELSSLSVDDFYYAVNEVNTENPFDSRSDELTQQLHIMIRHEIEREVIDEGRPVEEIPSAYDEKAEHYFGTKPSESRKGPLRSPHWSSQLPGFATYTLGSVLATQFWAVLEEDVDNVDKHIRNGDLGPIRTWLTNNIHQHGQRYRADDLIEEVTGETASATPFISYAHNKYQDIYDI